MSVSFSCATNASGWPGRKSTTKAEAQLKDVKPNLQGYKHDVSNGATLAGEEGCKVGNAQEDDSHSSQAELIPQRIARRRFGHLGCPSS